MSPLGQIFLPAFSLRDELRARFFGPDLWLRAAKIRKRGTDDKFNSESIEKLKLEMTGLARLAKKEAKKFKIPVQHKNEATGAKGKEAMPHNFRPGYSVGTRTLHKAYSGESSLDCKGRAKRFGAGETKARAVGDREYGAPRNACGATYY